MNRITMVAVTGILGLALAACGENNAPKPTVDKTETPVTTVPVNPAPANPDSTTTTPNQ